MSALLELAEHYYAVARDLEWRAAQMADVGKRLFQMADQMCEQHIRETDTKLEPTPDPTPPVKENEQ